MVTSIQINESAKKQLDELKVAKETYEQVIINLISISEKYSKEQEELLAEGYREMAKESLKINKEWEAIDSEMDWEWDENAN